MPDGRPRLAPLVPTIALGLGLCACAEDPSYTVAWRITDDPGEGPLVISSNPDLLPEGSVHATAFKGLVLDHIFG